MLNSAGPLLLARPGINRDFTFELLDLKGLDYQALPENLIRACQHLSCGRTDEQSIYRNKEGTGFSATKAHNATSSRDSPSGFVPRKR